VNDKDRYPLFRRIPQFEELSSSLILDRFLDYVAEKKQTLYPAQEEAVLALVEDQNVILNTPTGSGKSLVAAALHFHSLSMGRRSIYTSPIKALVNEKFLNLAREFGPEQVGLSTGDGSVNSDAPILCCTAEILANMALRDGENAKVDDVVMDEFHYYSDRDRGVAWQIPLLTLPRVRFMLMSATLGEMDFFQKELEKLTERTTVIISNQDRPVPLKFHYAETPIHETVKNLIDQGAAPVYLVCFSQREAAEQAQALLSVDFLSKEQKKEISEALYGTDFSSPYGKEISKFIKHGIGIHHGGLLPKYRILVEKLAQTGLLKIICGTDTLGVGVNIPIRTVLFTKLCKFDGSKTGILSVRDFHQISGRAGRKGFDTEGRVVAQAPEHVIENLKQELKAKADPKKAKKLVKAKPPEKGFVMWTEETFNKLIKSKPEALVSRFKVDHGILLNVLARAEDDGCKAMRKLIKVSHERPHDKKKHFSRSWELFRSLLNRDLLELVPPSSGVGRHRVRVNLNLQEDFSLDSSLSLYLIDTLMLLDPQSETYALDVLTLVESILESPDQILRKQLDKVKSQKMFEMKMAGVEFDQRIEELEKLEHPKPLREFIYSSFNAFSDKHPWVGTENIRPKSIAREMYEAFMSFGEYIREYELQRSEGLLLRYINDVWRALTVTVPSAHKTEEVDAITEYFGSIVRQIDSSLIDEWEKIRNPQFVPAAKVEAQKIESTDPFRDIKATRIRVLNEVFQAIRAFATKDFETLLQLLNRWADDGVSKDFSDEPWSEKRLENLSKEYHESHTAIRTDPSARGTKNIRINAGSEEWLVEHTLSDFDDLNDWQLVVRFSLAEGRKQGGRLVMSLGALAEV